MKPDKKKQLKKDYIAAVHDVLLDLSVEDESDDNYYILTCDKKIYDRYSRLLSRLYDAHVKLPV